LTDRIAEIRARIGDAAPITIHGPEPLVRAFEQKDADIAWLLAEVERLRQLTDHDEHWRRQFYALRNRVRKAGVSI